MSKDSISMVEQIDYVEMAIEFQETPSPSVPGRNLLQLQELLFNTDKEEHKDSDLISWVPPRLKFG